MAGSVSFRSASHYCAARRCREEIPWTLLMCEEHWFLVPLELQQTVIQARRRGERVTTSARFAALAHECIAAVDRFESLSGPAIP